MGRWSTIGFREAQRGSACAPPVLLLLIAACGPAPAPDAPAPVGEPPPAPPLAPVWSPSFAPAADLFGICAQPRLASELPWTPDDWPGLSVGAEHVRGLEVAEAGLLVADGRPAIYDELRAHPARAGCVAEALDDALRAAAAGPAPAAALVRLGARALGAPVADDVAVEPTDFALARAALCEAAGGCAEPQGELTEDLKAQLTPILLALADALGAEAALFEGDARGPEWWRAHGGHLILLGQQRPNPGYPADRAILLSDRARLYAAAERLARAVEAARWPEDVQEVFRLPTARGAVEVHGAGDDRHVTPALLRVDLGGDDRHLAEDGPISVLVDVGGDDLYAYPGAEGVDAAADLPADAAGRGDVEGLAAQATLSEAARQGGARGGVALTLDLGAGQDRYVSLRGGQGYAQLGVGVLLDAGGDDVYLAEAGAQGAAQLGIGLLIDLGAGQDRYEALHAAQGFAGPAGFGALVDDGGDDVHRCWPTPARHPAPQDPSVNASFCQGASLGFRAEVGAQALPGGLGVLANAGGDDAYEGAVFAQGVGYWLGTGLLLDGGGADTYRHRWYAAGSAAHFGVGVLADQGAGDDVYGDASSDNVTLGAAHHFGLGVLLEAGGADTYHAPTLGAGAALCGSLGLFVDFAGDDTYRAPAEMALGVAGLGDCEERAERLTRALFVDAAGADAYPEGMSAGDGGRWGRCLEEDPSARAAAADLE